MEMTVCIYGLTRTFPKDEQYGLTHNYGVPAYLSPAILLKVEAEELTASLDSF